LGGRGRSHGHGGEGGDGEDEAETEDDDGREDLGQVVAGRAHQAEEDHPGPHDHRPQGHLETGSDAGGEGSGTGREGQHHGREGQEGGPGLEG
jgi:hypothetical protein